MRKMTFATAASLLLMVTLTCGCGKKDRKISKAEKIIKESAAKMAVVSSFTSSGAGKVLTPQSETKEESFTFDGVVKVAGDDQVEAQMAGTSDGKQVQTIILGGYIYEYNSNSGWKRRKLDEAGGIGTAQFVNPSTIKRMTEFAESIRLMPDEGGNYVVAFDVGGKFFDNLLAELKEQMPQSSGAESSMMELIESVLAGIDINMVLKVDKGTMLWTEASIKASMEGVGVLGDMSTDTNLRFSEYNQPVTVSVPPEALNAPEVQQNQFQLPSLPGLGI